MKFFHQNLFTLIFAALLFIGLGLTACHAPASAAEAGEEAEAEVSDLDRPVVELFELACEHGMKMYECDECRYEAGVAKAPKDLFDQGLMTIARAERRKIETTRRLTGELLYDERLVSHLVAPVAGVVRRVQVTLGDRVVKGQPLIEIDSIEVGDIQAEGSAARQELALARANYDRAQSLRAENINSEKELLEARREFEQARIRANAAASRLTRLGAAGAGGLLILRAPADGMVLKLHAVPGERANTDEPLITVGDNSRLWLWADLYEEDVALVAAEQAKSPLAAKVTVKTFPGEDFPATAEFLNPAMDETTRTVKLRLAVPNPQGRLFAGTFANVLLAIPSNEEALALPAMAVVSDEGRSFVFIHRVGDFYVRRPVTVGRTSGDWVEITQGLEPGQEVVAKGSFLLKSDVLRSKMGAGCAD